MKDSLAYSVAHIILKDLRSIGSYYYTPEITLWSLDDMRNTIRYPHLYYRDGGYLAVYRITLFHHVNMNSNLDLRDWDDKMSAYLRWLERDRDKIGYVTFEEDKLNIMFYPEGYKEDIRDIKLRQLGI